MDDCGAVLHNIETKWLYDFLTLEKCRNFSQAAVSRNVSQPAFSRRIRALEQAMTEGNMQAAFNAAHTLRGVCQSLSFTQLCGTLNPITEALRGGNIAAAAADMDKAKREYDVTLSAIRACMEN